MGKERHKKASSTLKRPEICDQPSHLPLFIGRELAPGILLINNRIGCCGFNGPVPLPLSIRDMRKYNL